MDVGPGERKHKLLEMTTCLLKIGNSAKEEVSEPKVKDMLKEPHVIAEK